MQATASARSSREPFFFGLAGASTQMNTTQLRAWCAMWLPLLKGVNDMPTAIDLLKCFQIGLDEKLLGPGDRKQRLRDLWLWVLAQPNDVLNGFEAAVLSVAVVTALAGEEEVSLVVYRVVNGWGTLNRHLVPAVFEFCMQHVAPTSATGCMIMARQVLTKTKNVWICQDSELAATDTVEDHAPGSAMPCERQILYDNMVALAVAVMKRVLAETEHDNEFFPDDLDACES